MKSLSVLVFVASLAVVAYSTPAVKGRNDRGSWDVGVTKDKGRGSQVYAEGKGNVWSSKNGNWKVDAGGRWDAGKGRKPGYGGGVSVSGRWRREAVEPEEFRVEELNPEIEELRSEENSLKEEHRQEHQSVDDDQQIRNLRDVSSKIWPGVFRPIKPTKPRPLPRPLPRPYPML